MKKTFLKAFTTVIAVLALSLNVFAAGSIVGSIDMPNASSDRGKVTLSAVDLSKYSEKLQRIINRLNNARRGTTVKDAFGDDLPDSINLYDKSNVLKKNIDPSTYKFLSPVMDITFDSVTPTAEMFQVSETAAKTQSPAKTERLFSLISIHISQTLSFCRKIFFLPLSTKAVP